MKTIRFAYKKLITISIITILTMALCIILLISPIAKYWVEKYDGKYTGRRIKTGMVYVNPFTGFIHIRNLTIFENKSDSIFISMKGLSANLSLLKLFSRTIEISAITLDQPHIRIEQTKRDFNFDDIVAKFSVPTNKPKKKRPFHFNLLNIKIKEGHFYYVEKLIPVYFSIRSVNIHSKDGWRWTSDIISANLSFLSEEKTGSMKGSYSMNLKSLDYALNIIVKTFDLKVFEQYMKGFSNYGTLSANMDANLKTKGCYRNAENITIKGQLAINDFHFGKTPDEDYVAFEKVVLNMTEVNPGERKYFIDSVTLSHPYLKFEIYDNSNNLQTLFGVEGANISAAQSNSSQYNIIFKIADYIKILSKSFFKSEYTINRLGIYNGNVEFNDYSLNEKFSIQLNPLTVVSDSINKNYKRVKIDLTSGIQPYGKITAILSINPKDSSDFELNYQLQQLSATLFNPYLIAYTSYPLDRGTIEINGSWRVKNGEIKSENHLLIIDPRLTNRIRNKNNRWIPANFLMFFVRERGNVIDYEVPISGNLKDPNFKLKDILSDILGNIFIKPTSSSYMSEIKTIEKEIEQSLSLKWETRQSSLLSYQEEFIQKIVDFLIANPKATIRVYPMLYAEKEKEGILFFEARKKYFLVTNSIHSTAMNEKDSIAIDKMSIRDAKFVAYLNQQVTDTMLFTLNAKCTQLVGQALVNHKFNELIKERKISFLKYFKQGSVEKRVTYYTAENTVPYNGFSFNKIEYKNKLPESLLKAYQQMNELNDKAPRKRFEKERRNIELRK